MKTTSRPHTKASLSAAIEAIRDAAQSLRAQIDAKASERQALVSEIERLRSLPVCFEDWLPSLKAYIHACGQQAAPSGEILRVRGPYTKPFNERPAHHLGGGAAHFHEVIGGAPDGVKASPFSVLCFYLPDVVFERLSQHYRQAVGETWGNEELPRLKERERQAADLSAKVQVLDDELETLSAELAKLPALSDEQEAPASGVIGEPVALDVQPES